MPNSVRSAVRLIALAATATALVACGGDDDKEKTGQVQLSVTDAPVQDVDEVWVQFNAVEFKPEGGAPILEALATPQQIDLLAYQDGQAAVLVTDLELPAGRYEWIRLIIDDVPNVPDSYVVAAGAECEPDVPSGAESGLKLNRGFTLPANGSVALTVDFDLLKSLHAPPGQSSTLEQCTQGYLLRPTLRLVQDSEVGAIAGTVDVSRFSEAGCSRMVYVFEGDPATTTPDDYDGQDAEPVVTAEADEFTGAYKAAFLQAGNYTVAYTCSSEDSLDPAEDDSDDTPPFEFDPDEQGATVHPNLITTVDFGPLAP